MNTGTMAQDETLAQLIAGLTRAAANRKKTARKKDRQPKVSGTIKFNRDELKGLPAAFLGAFADRIARVIKTQEENGYTYEIRFIQNGYRIVVSDSDLKTCKEKFLAAARLTA